YVCVLHSLLFFDGRGVCVLPGIESYRRLVAMPWQASACRIRPPASSIAMRTPTLLGIAQRATTDLKEPVLGTELCSDSIQTPTCGYVAQRKNQRGQARF